MTMNEWTTLLSQMSSVASSEPRLPSKVTQKTLTDAIANCLYQVSAHQLAEECVRYGLPPQSPDEPDPFAGKVAYVARRVRDFVLPRLLVLASRVNDDYDDPGLTRLLTLAARTGVSGAAKNLIFASDGPKPEIVLRDAVNNDIEIVRHQENCLIYQRAISESGLSWRDLTAWWADRDDLTPEEETEVARDLYNRLTASMRANNAELRFFAQFCALYGIRGFDLPALLPQVYLHYDPYSRGATSGQLTRQRMDFLMLLPARRRVVIEIDGVQHYANPKTRQAAPDEYGRMVAADRDLTLAGYEVYRFARAEVTGSSSNELLSRFFDRLLVDL